MEITSGIEEGEDWEGRGDEGVTPLSAWEESGSGDDGGGAAQSPSRYKISAIS